MLELKTDLKTTRTNPLIGRKEIEFEIKEQATPSRAEVRRDIAVIMKTDLRSRRRRGHTQRWVWFMSTTMRRRRFRWSPST